jgi:trigger factor
MQVSVENTSALERRMSITVPAERIEIQVLISLDESGVL